MMNEQYMYTYQYEMMGEISEEECYINKDSFYPFGEVAVGNKLRGEFGFMEIIKIFDEPHIKYGKFIAKSIPYKHMNL